MDNDLSHSVPGLPRSLQKKLMSDFKTVSSKRDKIKNVLSIHHHNDDADSQSLEVDLKTNSVTVNQSDDCKKIHKTFLFDSVSYKDNVCSNVLIAAIKAVAEKKDGFILSAGRGLKKKFEHANRVLLHTLVKWLLEYLVVCSENGDTRYSVRLSGIEINEETDVMKELGSTIEEDRPITVENQYCHRCADLEAANHIINQFYSNTKHNDRSRSQYLYTIHVYHQTSHSSVTSSVSAKCSRIYFLTMDLTKQKSNEYSLSPPGLAKLLMASLDRNSERKEMQTNFHNLLFDISRRHAGNFSMITQVSLKAKHAADTYQMLQLASRIQRLKVKSKKCWDCKDNERPHRPTMGTSGIRKGDKFSDTEVASTSEMSCAETVIFLGEEHRRNSDDDSRRLRAMFLSSDSDSGYRDWKLSRSGGSRGATPVNESKKQIRLRTNAMVWPKSALRMAKTALMNGEELWVDGPNATRKGDPAKTAPLSLSISSTPETIKQIMSPCCQVPKPIMVSQETQCDDLSLPTGKMTSEDVRPLSDISELTEDNDTLRNTKGAQSRDDGRFKSPTPQPVLTSDEYSNLERNDVQNLSNWIQDINDLTSYQDCLTRSLHENLTPLQSKLFLPVLNESPNSHSYQYYDPGSQGEYNSFPRVYPQIQYTQTNLCNPLPVRCCSFTPDLDKEKTIDIHKKKSFTESASKERSFKPKPFSPFELLKKTLLRKKKKDISENISETPISVPRCPELMYLMPSVHSPDDDSSDSTSSDSECNEWFRNVKSFKSKAEYQKNKCTSIRPPSAPLLACPGSVPRSQYSFRQRSSSSGYGSVVTRGDSELSSHLDSTSDQSIHSSLKNAIKQSISFTHQTPQYHSVPDDDLDPGLIAQRCELLVKQEKAFLLIQQQEMMVQDFYGTTRPLLTSDQSKYTLRVSSLDINRVSTDNQYLEELEEDTNIIRDSIAFYKSLVHLESSFISSPDLARRNIH